MKYTKKQIIVIICLLIFPLITVYVFIFMQLSFKPLVQVQDNEIEDIPSSPISYSQEVPVSYSDKKSSLIEIKLQLPDMGTTTEKFTTIKASISNSTSYSVIGDMLTVKNSNSIFILQTSLGEDSGLFDHNITYSEIREDLFSITDEKINLPSSIEIEDKYKYKTYYSNQIDFTGCFGRYTHCGTRELKIGDNYFKAYCISKSTDLEECNSIVESLEK